MPQTTCCARNFIAPIGPFGPVHGLNHPLARGDAQPDRIELFGTETLGFGLSPFVNHWKKAMSTSLTKLAPAAVILIGAVGLSGCATKSFVREQVATVSSRVDTLEAKLQETDGIAKSADATAKSAQAEAQAASGAAQNNGQRLDQLNARVDGIEQRMQAQENKRKRPRN